MGDTIKKKLALLVGMDSKAAAKGMKLLQQKMRAFGDFAVKWGKRAALAILAIGAAIIKVGMDFDTAMREVWTLMPQLSKAALDAMGQQVLEFAQIYGKSSKDIAKALYDVVSAQIPVNQQMAVLEAGTRGAVAGITSVAEATSALISVMKVFGTEAGSASLVMDKLFKIVEYGRLTFADLASGLGRVLPAAKDAGVSFEEVGAALAMTTQGGLSSAESVTALRMMLLAMAAPASEAAKKMKELGMTFVDTAGNLIPLQDILKQFIGLTLAQLKEIIPGIRGLQGLSGLRRSFDELEGTLEAVTNATGATELAFEKMAGGLRTQWGRVVQTLKRSGIELYDMFQEDLVIAVGALQMKFGDLVSWIKSNKGEIIAAGESIKNAMQRLYDVVKPLMEFVIRHKKEVLGFFITLGAIAIVTKLYALAAGIKAVTVALGALAISPAFLVGAGVVAGLVAIAMAAVHLGLVPSKSLEEFGEVVDNISSPARLKGLSDVEDKLDILGGAVDRLTSKERFDKLWDFLWDTKIAFKEWSLEIISAEPIVVKSLDSFGEAVDRLTAEKRLMNLDNLAKEFHKVSTAASDATRVSGLARLTGPGLKALSLEDFYQLVGAPALPVSPGAPAAPPTPPAPPILPTGLTLQERLKEEIIAFDDWRIAKFEESVLYEKEMMEMQFEGEQEFGTQMTDWEEQHQEELYLIMKKYGTKALGYKLATAKIEELQVLNSSARMLDAWAIMSKKSVGFALNMASTVVSAFSTMLEHSLHIRAIAGDWTAILQLAALATETVASLSQIQRMKDEAAREQPRESYREIEEGERRIYGQTVAREPQQITIAPVLHVEAEGDVYFSQDGMEAASDVMIDHVKQAVIDGEIAVG